MSVDDDLKPYEEVEEEVLARVKPTEYDRKLIESVYAKLRTCLERGLKASGLEASISLEGSVAKDTWTRGEYDVDVFVFFPRDLGKRWLKEKGIAVIEEALKGFKVTKAYAEHPYLKVKVDGIEVDVVPALKLNDPKEAVTAVDRTPFHREYVTRKLTQRLRDEVRLLKSFLRGIGAYGAEIKVRGFSGYLAELLVIHYGGFREVVKEASKWRPPVLIDPEGHYAGRPADALRRFKSPLIVVDPVDPARNAAAAVSLTKLGEFVVASRLYLERPSVHYFFPPELEWNPRELSGRVNNVVAVHYSHAGLVDDVIWGELYRLERRLTSLVKGYGFNVTYSMPCRLSETRSILLFEVQQPKLWSLTVRVGPPWYADRGVYDFVRKHARDPGGPYVGSDGRLRSLSVRRYVDACSLLTDLVKEYGSTKHLRPSDPGVACGRRVLELLSRMGGGLRCLAEFIYRKPPWLRAYLASLRS